MKGAMFSPCLGVFVFFIWKAAKGPAPMKPYFLRLDARPGFCPFNCSLGIPGFFRLLFNILGGKRPISQGNAEEVDGFGDL